MSRPPTPSPFAPENSRFVETVVLGDDARIRIRALTPEDRAGLARLFSRLSPESRYRRFFAPKRDLTDRELDFFADVDHVGHEALAALDERDDSIVGVARYVQYVDNPRVAAVAFEVADEWQRRGIGTALTRRLLTRARINGLVCLSATTRWENLPARALLRRLDFHARTTHGGEIQFDLELESLRQQGPSADHARDAGQRRGLLMRVLAPGVATLVAAVLLALPGSAAW